MFIEVAEYTSVGCKPLRINILHIVCFEAEERDTSKTFMLLTGDRSVTLDNRYAEIVKLIEDGMKRPY